MLMTMNEILGPNGFGDSKKLKGKDVKICKKWIEEWVTPRKTINPNKGSYGLKHSVEKWSRDYIPNGAFIKAAIELGYKYEEFGPNAIFNMSFVKARKSPTDSRIDR